MGPYLGFKRFLQEKVLNFSKAVPGSLRGWAGSGTRNNSGPPSNQI